MDLTGTLRDNGFPIGIVRGLLGGLVPCSAAEAHSFGQLYTLPIPVTMYVYAAAAVLLVSFLMIGLFASGKGIEKNFVVVRRWLRRPAPRRGTRWVSVCRFASVCCMFSVIAAGLVGSDNAYQNVSMTLFWILFVLGMTYLCAAVGDIYEVINPWRVVVDALERSAPGTFAGRRPWPTSWACYPALFLFIVFIWVELFAHMTPRTLAAALSLYTLLNVGGAWLFGRAAWFRQGEFFGYYFHLVGKMAPLQRESGPDGKHLIVVRHPFIALLNERPTHISQVLFVLFMLSSTAYDGIKDTELWMGIFWRDFHRAMMPLMGGDIVATYAIFQAAFKVYQALAIPAFLGLYLVVYLAFIWLSKCVVKSTTSTFDLACRYAFTLIPIALVYNLSHYYTLALAQGAQLYRLASDPLGYGWNLFGTARRPVDFFLDVELVWHSQVWLIIAGHIVSVYLAHLRALEDAPPGRAALGQLPVLLLMVALTGLGLWILSLPIQAGVAVG